MKTTTKIKTLLFVTLSMFFASNVSAQENTSTNYDQGFRLGFGVSGGYVFDEPYGFGLGGDARLQYDLTKKYSLTLTTGFTNFFVSGDDNDLGFIPAKAGFKAFVWGDQFYLMGEVGAAFAVTNNNDRTSLILAPSIGYATKYIDLSLRYEHYNNFYAGSKEGTGQLALRLAYGFKL